MLVGSDIGMIRESVSRVGSASSEALILWRVGFLAAENWLVGHCLVVVSVPRSCL